MESSRSVKRSFLMHGISNITTSYGADNDIYFGSIYHYFIVPISLITSKFCIAEMRDASFSGDFPFRRISHNT